MADETKVYRCAHRRAILLAFHGGCFMGGNSGWDAKQNTMLASMGFEVHQLAFPKNWLAWQSWAKSFRWDLLKQTNLAEPANLAEPNQPDQPTEPDPPNHMAKPVQQDVPVVCLGRSSGGYLACMFAAMHSSKISKLILMAPVLNPLKRANILVSFRANTQQFFQTDKPNQPNQPDHANQPDQPDHKNQPDQPDHNNQPDHANQPDRMVVPARYDPDKTLLLLARKDENVPAWLFSTAQIRQAVFSGPSGHVGLMGCTSGRLKQIIQEFVF